MRAGNKPHEIVAYINSQIHYRIESICKWFKRARNLTNQRSVFLMIWLFIRGDLFACSKLTQRVLGSQVRWRLEQLHSCAPMFSDMNGFRSPNSNPWDYSNRVGHVPRFVSGILCLLRLFEKFLYKINAFLIKI